MSNQHCVACEGIDTLKEIFENMFIQYPKAKEKIYMYMHSDEKYDYFKDKLTREYIRAIK